MYYTNVDDLGRMFGCSLRGDTTELPERLDGPRSKAVARLFGKGDSRCNENVQKSHCARQVAQSHHTTTHSKWSITNATK